jgi:hypothetical protein
MKKAYVLKCTGFIVKLTIMWLLVPSKEDHYFIEVDLDCLCP